MPPDIYYIILDGYGRRDVLSEMYGIDQASFYEALRGRGFTVADDSYTNYAQTSLSLASSLNFAYLDAADLAASPDNAQLTVAAMIRHSAIADILRRHGYLSLAYAVGYRRAEMSSADIFIFPPPRSTTPFEAMLLETNGLEGALFLPPLWGGQAWLPGYAGQRELIRFILEQAARIADRPEPTFAFVHLLVPHPPFVFEAKRRRASAGFPLPAARRQ